MVSRGPLPCPPDGLAKPSVRSNTDTDTDTSPLSPRGDSPLRTNLWIGPNQPQVDYPREAQATDFSRGFLRSEEHTSELQSRLHLVCRLLLEKKKKYSKSPPTHCQLNPLRHSS